MPRKSRQSEEKQQETAAKLSRLRVPAGLPKPTSEEDSRFLWADNGDRMRPTAAGHRVSEILASDAFDQTVGKWLDEVDEATTRPGKCRRAYSARELEAVELFQRVMGHRSARRGRKELTGDEASGARLAMGLGHDRVNIAWQHRMRGVPSEATLCRHRQRLDTGRRADLWRECFDLFAAETLRREPQLARTLHVDGTDQPTEYKVPGRWIKPDGDDNPGRKATPQESTAQDAAYRGNSESDHAHCAGYRIVSVQAQRGLPLAFEVGSATEGEPGLAVTALDHIAPVLRDAIPHGQAGVITGDNGFQSDHVRRAARNAHLVENIHHSSHKKTSKDAPKRAEQRDILKGTDWMLNGHREPVCKCGHGTWNKRIGFKQDGTPVPRVICSCSGDPKAQSDGNSATDVPHCRPLCITSGEWHDTNNEKELGQGGYDRHSTPAHLAVADLSVGNPLTYNDNLSQAYGDQRHGHQEGFFAVLSTRFGFGQPRRYRHRRQVELDAAMTFVGLHATHQYVRFMRQLATPPQTAAAA